MRIWERLSYLFGVGLAVTYGLEEYIASLVALGLTTLALIIGAFMEGYRFPQWVFIVAFIPQIILVTLDVFSIIALCIYSTFLGYAIFVSFIFGENNLNWAKVNGPYEVGYREFHTEADGLLVSVYYPMDRDEYAECIDQPGRNPKWLRYGAESRMGVAKATAAWGTEDHSHPWMFKYLEQVTINVVKDGKIANDFTGGAAKQLIPAIYDHGLTCNGVAQSISCRDLASHGYIVFAMDHFDGSCYISKKKDGTTRFWSSMETWGEKATMFKKLSQRKEELTHLIDDICTEGMLQKMLDLDSEVHMDLNKLILGGHSFGGLTTIFTANTDTRVKCVFGFDAFLYPISEELDAGQINLSQPQMHIITEGFAPRIQHFFEMDLMNELRDLIEKSKAAKQGQLVTLLHTNHIHQTDAIVIIPVESTISTCSELRLNYIDLLLLNTQSLLLWLDSIGYGGYGMEAGKKRVEDFVENNEEEFLDFHIKNGVYQEKDRSDKTNKNKDMEGGQKESQEPFTQHYEDSSYEICADEEASLLDKTGKSRISKPSKQSKRSKKPRQDSDDEETASLLRE